MAESISEILLSDSILRQFLRRLTKEQTECLVIGARTTKLKSWMFFKIGLLLELGYISFENEQYSLCDEVKDLVAKCYTNESKVIWKSEINNKLLQCFCGTLRNCSVGQGFFEIYDKQNHDISKKTILWN